MSQPEGAPEAAPEISSMNTRAREHALCSRCDTRLCYDNRSIIIADVAPRTNTPDWWKCQTSTAAPSSSSGAILSLNDRGNGIDDFLYI